MPLTSPSPVSPQVVRRTTHQWPGERQPLRVDSSTGRCPDNATNPRVRIPGSQHLLSLSLSSFQKLRRFHIKGQLWQHVSTWEALELSHDHPFRRPGAPGFATILSASSWCLWMSCEVWLAWDPHLQYYIRPVIHGVSKSGT